MCKKNYFFQITLTYYNLLYVLFLIKALYTQFGERKAPVPHLCLRAGVLKVTFRPRGTPELCLLEPQLATLLTVSFWKAYFGPKAISKLAITEACNRSLQTKQKETLQRQVSSMWWDNLQKSGLQRGLPPGPSAQEQIRGSGQSPSALSFYSGVTHPVMWVK